MEVKLSGGGFTPFIIEQVLKCSECQGHRIDDEKLQWQFLEVRDDHIAVCEMTNTLTLNVIQKIPIEDVRSITINKGGTEAIVIRYGNQLLTLIFPKEK